MATIKAVLFDMDGVICDTERDGHRVSFNMAFKEFGFQDEWSVEQYHALLQVGGGKERMKHYWETHGFSRPVPPDQIDQLIKDMHKRKTALYVELIKAGKLPLRPGVHRFMQEAGELGLKRAVCTTSNEQAATAMIDSLLSDIPFDLVLAGDVVSRKKPDPEIYNLALSRLGLKPGEAFAVEDSRNGVLAAKNAGLRVVVTTNAYTEQEDVTAGDIIVTCLGDSPADGCKLRKGDVPFDGILHVSDVMKAFSR
jgi:HAD superfamily hydrolase (TIGR01509 family)